MLSAFLLIFIVLAIVLGGILDEDIDWCIVLGCLVFIGECILLGFLIHAIYAMPQKINMYQEENQIIEAKIENTVEKYMSYEKDIIFEISPDDDAMSLITLYPDLKSDQLIQSEIDTYVSNNRRIKELKDQMIGASVLKFLLYFGH